MLVFRNFIHQSISIVVRQRFRIILDRTVRLQSGGDFSISPIIRRAIILCVVYQTRRLSEWFQLVPEQR